MPDREALALVYLQTLCLPSCWSGYVDVGLDMIVSHEASTRLRDLRARGLKGFQVQGSQAACEPPSSPADKALVEHL